MDSTTDATTHPRVNAASPDMEASQSNHPSPSDSIRQTDRSPESTPSPFPTAASTLPSSSNEESVSSTSLFTPFISKARSTVSPCGTSTSLSMSLGTSSKRAGIVPSALPCVLGPCTGLSPSHASQLLAKDRFPFPPSSLPLSPRDAFYPPTPPHSNPHAFTFPSSIPPSIVRPMQTSGLPWPIQPVPLRVSMGLRPDFGTCGVVSPEEVPSPPGSAVADMPASPILGVRSPGLDQIRGFAESVRCVDMNNNNNSSGLVGGNGEDVLKGGQKNQRFKTFLEVGHTRTRS